MKVKLLLLLFSLAFTKTSSQIENPINCIEAANHLFNLEFAKAREYLGHEKLKNPNNLTVYYYENYIDFFETVIDGSESRYSIYKKNSTDRISKIKSLGDISNPFYLLYLSEIYLQTTLVNGQFQEFVNAGLNFYRSYKYTEENIERYPYFNFNKKTKGIHHLIISIIPDEYEELFSFLGFTGTSGQGLNNIKDYYQFAYKKPGYNIEAIIFKFFVMSQFTDDDFAPVNFLKEVKYDTLSNKIINICYLLALKQTDNTDESIKFIEEKKLSDYNLPHLYYLIGSLKLTRLDDDANIYFEKYLKYYKGEHMIKHTHEKLAWYYFLNNDPIKYNYHLNCVKTQGAMVVEHDRQSFYEMLDTLPLNKTLLKARLLFDGGYYNKALSLLMENSSEFKNTNLKYQVEYFYRLGRIYQRLNNFEKAKKYLTYTVNFGENISDYYFVSYAAYNLGLIYEQEKNYPESKDYYKKCIVKTKKSYYPGIIRKAKIGLKRVNEIT